MLEVPQSPSPGRADGGRVDQASAGSFVSYSRKVGAPFAYGAIVLAAVVGASSSINEPAPPLIVPMETAELDPMLAPNRPALEESIHREVSAPEAEKAPAAERRPETIVGADENSITSEITPGQSGNSAEVEPTKAEPAKPERVDEVKEYLWKVYQRSGTKIDSRGDFTWKDASAAERLGLSLKDYVIGGMDPDFREQLFSAGQALDAERIDWTILSAFRDDYRQALAAGYKARDDNSFHGGSAATTGYGHGCAVDITSTDRLSDDAVWTWLDRHGGKFGLYRPFRGIDPAHLQPNGKWHELASNLRSERGGVPIDLAAAGTGPTPAVGLTEEQYNCVRSPPPVAVVALDAKPAIVHRLNAPGARKTASGEGKDTWRAKGRMAGATAKHQAKLEHSSPDGDRGGRKKSAGSPGKAAPAAHLHAKADPMPRTVAPKHPPASHSLLQGPKPGAKPRLTRAARVG
jgi:hypothetical protein